MFSKKKKPVDNLDSREELIRAGIELFAKDGIDGTTVRDIAKVAGTNICMVSYHFDGKEGLYRACLEKYGKQRAEGFKGLVHGPKTLAELELMLRMIVTNFANSQVENPELTRMLVREMEQGLPNAADVFEETFLKLNESLIEFFRGAQKQGLVREELSPFLLTMLIYGAVGHVFRFEVIGERYFKRAARDPKNVQELVDHAVGIFIRGIQKEGAAK